jgi:large subunit ribosomal protein L15
MPLQRRIPKRGFKNFNRVEYQGVNVRDLSRIDTPEVTPEVLKSHGLIRSLKKPVKILGTGEVETAFQVSAHAFSAAAREKIEAAGGTVTVLGESAVDESPASAAVTDEAESEGALDPEVDEASEAEDAQA